MTASPKNLTVALQPGSPGPNKDVRYRSNRGESHKALNVKLVELLGFLVSQSGNRGLIRHANTPSQKSLSAEDAHNPRNLSSQGF